ncbi:major tail protein [Bacillus subtilis]|uniref:major tail protein n=1 Tax=Bacillus subtilis group TaxID=653685 RepID=UPI0004E04AD4|nr:MULTISPECIES: major tail protein [Bacillus subtilis group]AII36477.1 major tail protein [Bacillus subtilis TO-A]AKN14770.1 Phage major tail protein [Bacillus subtilis]MCY8064338.1 phage tail protein [Bacillus spizizenii]MEC1800577.1 phage tail protein [Bacillus mojavensis]
MGKILTGLDMFHIAEVLQDTKDELEFSVPEELPGAVSMKLDPKSETETFYADNGAYAQLSSLGDIDGEMEVADLPLDMQARIFGKTVENGIHFSSADDRPLEIALGFRAKISTGGYRYYWALKGKPELVPVEHKTEEGKPSPQSTQVKIKFSPLTNVKKGKRRWEAKAEEGNGINADTWFRQVVYNKDSFTSGGNDEVVDVGK